MHALVVSMNPAIDAEWRVDEVRWEEKNVVHSERRWAGGKGANVVRWLQHLQAQPRLLTPLGGLTGSEFLQGLRREKLAARVVRLKQPTRVNVVITAADGRQMRFNPPGPQLSASEWRQVYAAAKKELAQASCLILSGALPYQAPVDTYARFIRLAHSLGVKTVLDCDGPALTAGVKAQPFLLKPNEYELLSWAKVKDTSEAAVLQAAYRMSRQADAWVMVSRGAQGAMLVHTREGVVMKARGPRVQVVNTVGAGDSLLAGAAWQMSRGAAPAEWLRWGVAVATAATQYPGGKLAPKALIRRFYGELRVGES